LVLVINRTRPALLRLAESASDLSAQATIYEENEALMKAAVTHWLAGWDYVSAMHQLLHRIAKRARFYGPEGDPVAWLATCVDLECRRLRDEADRRNHRWWWRWIGHARG
jgi:hypothetical protein